MRRLGVLVAALALGAAAGCGDDGGETASSGQRPAAPVQRTRVEVIRSTARASGGFDPGRIYAEEGPGVVTIKSVFPGGGARTPLGGGDGGEQAGQGSGFVISADGEVATNAHVVTTGEGTDLERARQVFVQFEDGNEVPARIVGDDPDSDVALLRIAPEGLRLRPLVLGASRELQVGAPVAAIGSPFGEPQSLSVGIVSGLDRTIQSLTNFSISGAVQTDAAINHGNSGGPLVDARGRVIGINSQIRSTGGGGEGVGFAVPVDTVKRSLDQLRTRGKVQYAYLGIQSTPVYPQLARRFGLGVDHGAWVQRVTEGGPADKAGLRAGEGSERFHAQSYAPGGDVIAAVDGRPIRRESDLSQALVHYRPGQRIALEIHRGRAERRTVVTLADRPDDLPARPQP